MMLNPAPVSTPSYYNNVNPTLLAAVDPAARFFLELGCGTGQFANAVRQRQPVSHYIGIDISEEALKLSGGALDVALHRNLDLVSDWSSDNGLRVAFQNKRFDHLILGDVLEHLYSPGEVLRQAVNHLRDGGSALVCVPNVQHWSVLAQLLVGHWPQTDAGLFDRTHVRWFTLRDIAALMESCGLTVERIIPRIFQPEAGTQLLQALEPALRLVGVAPEKFNQLSLPLQYVLIGRKK